MFDLTHTIKEGTRYNIIALQGTHKHDVYAQCDERGFCTSNWSDSSYRAAYLVFDDEASRKAFKGQILKVIAKEGDVSKEYFLATVYPNCVRNMITQFPSGDFTIE